MNTAIGLAENMVHNVDNRDGLLMLADKCAQLIIADPPYFEVKGQFDFVWDSFEQYLAFMELQAKLYQRILAHNGTLYVYGNSKRIAYIQIIFDKYFRLINSIVWRKIDSIQYQYYSPQTARAFTTHNERLLMYEHHKENNKVIGKYLQSEFERAKIKMREVAKLFPSKTGGMTGCVSNWINGNNVITKEQYEQIKTFLGNGYLEKPYDVLIEEYEQEERYFNNTNKYDEVFEFSQEGHTTKQYDHETVKPELMTRMLIMTSTKKNDLVVVPFAGSGTECSMAVKENRRTIGFEINKEYADMANNRIALINKTPSLFQ